MPPGNDFLRDRDGDPVLDADNQPITVEPGTIIRETADDGHLYSSDGTPVTDKFGESSFSPSLIVEKVPCYSDASVYLQVTRLSLLLSV